MVVTAEAAKVMEAKRAEEKVKVAMGRNAGEMVAV